MEWSKGYSSSFKNLSLEDTPAGSENFTRRRVNPSSLNWEESMDLKESLEKFHENASGFANDWKYINAKFDDRRSFPTFLWLQISGLDWHKYIASKENDNELNANQLNSWWSLQGAASHDVVHLRPDLASNSIWVMANKYYSRSLLLRKLLRRIFSNSSSKFSREQAGLLASFLDHLIMIQQEQRVVAHGFSEHLEQLKKSDAASLLAFSSNSVVDNGDMDKYCPFTPVKHPMKKFMWQQKHLFDSLYIMSRESTWLLRKLESSHSSNPSFVGECHKVLEIMVLFISKFKKSKELLNQYLLDEFLQNKETLDDFGKCITDLKEQGVGRESVTETLLRCFGDAVNQGKITMDEYYFGAEQRNLSGDSCCSVQDACAEADEETLELINEAVEKLNSVRCSTLTDGGSSLGNITLWNVLFEASSCKSMLKQSNLGVNSYLNQLHESTETLLTFGESILVEFLGIHRTVAEMTYMLGDAFTTGDAGMNDVSDETRSEDASNDLSRDNGEGIDIDFEFPWDKHCVLDEIEIDPNDLEMLWDVNPSLYGPDSDDDFT
ncbi:hypothetical protein MKX01_035526 [Papaver californicum]|nr:hypothetical protein MKX01_035526 [Papaver californicum]